VKTLPPTASGAATGFTSPNKGRFTRTSSRRARRWKEQQPPSKLVQRDFVPLSDHKAMSVRYLSCCFYLYVAIHQHLSCSFLPVTICSYTAQHNVITIPHSPTLITNQHSILNTHRPNSRARMEIAKRLSHRRFQSVYRHGIRHRTRSNAARGGTRNGCPHRTGPAHGQKWSAIQTKLNRSADACSVAREMSDEHVIPGRSRNGT
jgi:hypothetical protein